MSIHPLAAVDPTARIGPHVQIGPFCVVESDVSIGERCVLENHVVIKRATTLGDNNRVFEGAVLGGLPQHIHVPKDPGRVVIGSENTIRENVTVHRAMEPDAVTSIGDNNLLMANSHVAHNCRLGNHVIITNNVMLAGHVTVADRAYLAGGAGAHQFVSIGTLAMVGGLAHVSRDVPPFVTIDGLSGLVVGLNRVGLRRAGFDARTIGQLKEAYQVIYRSGLTWSEILRRLKSQFPEGAAAEFYRLFSTTQRGITPERRPPPDATIKLRRATEVEPRPHAKAG